MANLGIDKRKTGAKIKALILNKHLKISEVSEYMGFHEPRAVYKWINGVSLPSVDNLFRLSVLLETTMDEIIQVKEIKDERQSSSFDFIWRLLIYGYSY